MGKIPNKRPFLAAYKLRLAKFTLLPITWQLITEMVQFLDPKNAKILQFLDPEILKMDQNNPGFRNCRNGAISGSINRKNTTIY